MGFSYSSAARSLLEYLAVFEEPAATHGVYDEVLLNSSCVPLILGDDVSSSLSLSSPMLLSEADADVILLFD